MIAGNFTPIALSEFERPDHPLSLGALGIVLVPDVVTRTPPYIDRVVSGSPAARAGLLPDDLLVMIDSQVTASCREAGEWIKRFERDKEVRVAVLRKGAFLEFKLQAEPVEEE
jgi:serine protease Do